VPAAFGRSILVLVPHPDDEVVGCCAAIGRARAQGATIYALYLTHGCVDHQSLWLWDRGRSEGFIARRWIEAMRVAGELGVACAGRSARPARHLWRELTAAHREVEGAIEDHAIDQIWAPAYEGGNPDHDAANALASRFVLAPHRLSVLEFAEYNFAGGKVRSQAFARPGGDDEIMSLTPAEQAFKRRCLGLYASERDNLRTIRAERECFRPIAAYDYAAPPHEGVLWYARHQWVPFRHPRVDFSDPQDVSAAITSYLRESASPAGSAG
jgi:LmbE family N-acetylglucosaminyl deacetylase